MQRKKKRFPLTERFLANLRKLRRGNRADSPFFAEAKAGEPAAAEAKAGEAGVCNGNCKWEEQMFCNVCKECGWDDY